MIVVSLPAPLAVLLDGEHSSEGRRVRAVSLDVASWPQVVAHLREQHPRLAERIFDPAGDPVAGVALVVNGEVVRSKTINVAGGDEISFIPQIAGG